MTTKRKHFANMHWLHWVIIALSLLVTVVAWYFSQQQVEQKRLAQFNRESSHVIELVIDRMSQYEDALSAGIATIKSQGGAVNFNQWKDYVDNLELLQKYPGINGLGVIHLVRPNELKKYLGEQRLLRPDYNIHPAHKQNIYLPITYIIPVKGNEKAVGLDMAHENNRYSAALTAMKTGKPQITEPITLVQDQEKTPGFLFYLPYYKDNQNKTKAQRIKYFEGFVYAPFIMKQLMSGVLAKENRNIVLKISDGEHTLYDEMKTKNIKYDDHTDYHFSEQISIYGQNWTFNVQASKGFNALVTNKQPMTILIMGICIDILLLILFMIISRSNKKAIEYAHQVTADLKKSNDSLQLTQVELKKTAHHDALTQLPNRYSFMRYLNTSIARLKINKTLLAICVIDLDNFKLINDSLNHQAGDRLIQKITDLLNKKLRAIDYLARLDGDEFAIIIDQVKTNTEIATIVEHYMSIFKNNILLDNNELRVTASAGIAVTTAQTNDSDELIQKADLAINKAKQSGKSCYEFYNDEINKQIKRRNDVLFALQGAISEDEFHLVYQPQIDSHTGKIYGIEALIRWKSKTLGEIYPDEFIPIAEESDYIIEIGNWVIRQIGTDYEQIKSIDPNLEISINVSIRQLEDPELGVTISQVIQSHGLYPDKITLEVTETAAMRNPHAIIDYMYGLKKFNIHFALDDFGTGHCSLGYLKRMPISYIKIDRSFINDIETDKFDIYIIKAIISLSKAIETKTIAEGVETEKQRQFLKEHDCDYMQGYHFDRPLLLEALIKKYKK